jgi:hypothetical protein
VPAESLDAEAAVRVARVAAERARLPPPSLVRIGSSAVFRCGDTALRVGQEGSDAAAAVRLAHFLGTVGIPVLEPLADPFDIEGLPVTIWPWVERSTDEVDGDALGQIVARLHAIRPEQVESVVDVPSWSWGGAADPRPALDEICSRSLLSAPHLERLEAVYAQHAGWHHRTEAPTVMCHGDLHPNNVVVATDGLWLIDWDSVCLAQACWDHAMLTTLDLWGGPPGFYSTFAHGYGYDYSADRGCRDLAVLRLLTATANLVLKAQRDQSALPQVDIRLGYWMGEHVGARWTHR